MPKYLHTFESLISATSQIPPGFDPGQLRQHLVENTDRTTVDVDAVKKALNFGRPEQLKAEDLILGNEQQEQRKKLVEKAQDKLLDAVTQRGIVPVPEDVEPYQAQMFRQDDSEENKNHNEKLRKAIETGDMKTQAELYSQYLAGLPKFDPDSIVDMSDDTLLDTFPALYGLYQAATEAIKLLREKDPDSLIEHVSPETKQQMEQLALDQRLLAAMKNRFETIANPYYAMVDTDRLPKEDATTQHMDHLSKHPGVVAEFRSFSAHIRDANQTPSFQDLAAGRRMAALLQQRGFDPDTLQIVDFSDRKYPLWEFFSSGGEDALKNKPPLIFRDGKGHTAALRQNNEKLEDINLDYLATKNQTEALTTRLEQIQQLTNSSVADPFWMLTGSGEYRELKAALEAHADVVKQVGNPPDKESLRSLHSSVARLGAAAQHYLAHKDPTIGEDTDFDSYIENHSMSERETARLKAAFAARDLARDTKGAVSINLHLNNTLQPTTGVDQMFYQGILRKYNQLEKALDERMKSEEFAQKLSDLLDGKEVHGSVRPQDADADMTLLWELHQMNDLIERTEQAMGLRASQRAIDQTLKESADTATFFGVTDLANKSVEELFGQLENAVSQSQRQQTRQAKQSAPEQPQLSTQPRKPNYKPREFLVDKKIMKSDIVLSNDSSQVQDYLDKNRSQLSSAAREHLEHRIKSLERIEQLEKDPKNRTPRETCEVTEPKDGQDKPKKYMLKGVRERRSQTTMNGCWSVSLCSQLEYRGVELSQEEIRAYRPNAPESGTHTDGKEHEFYQNIKQTIGAYNGLVGRVLPNSHLNCMEINFNKGQELARDRLRATVFTALTRDNSPVSLCARGHYVTIVGMEGDTFYVKNPMHLLGGDPEALEKWTVDDILKKSKGRFELDWISDVKVTLGGNIESNRTLDKGFFYSGGTPHPGLRDEETEPFPESTRIVCESIQQTFSDDSGKQVHVGFSIDGSRHLHYKRLPGSGYNADALKEMTDKLGKTPDPAPGLHGILNKAVQLQEGRYETNPHKGMLALAQEYVNALKATNEMLKEKVSDLDSHRSNLEQYKDTLLRQLKDIRTAVEEIQVCPYKLKMGSIEDRLAFGNLDSYEEVGKNLGVAKKKDFEIRRKRYENLKEGFSGALYFKTTEDIPLEDERWIKALSPENIKKGTRDIHTSDAFNNMIQDIYRDLNDFETLIVREQTGEKNKDPNTEKRRKELVKLAKLNSNDYSGPVKKKDQTGECNFAFAVDLRLSVRNGKSDVLYRRYMDHLNLVNKKTNPTAIDTHAINTDKAKSFENHISQMTNNPVTNIK